MVSVHICLILWWRVVGFESLPYEILGSNQEDIDWYDDDEQEEIYEDEDDYGGFFLGGEYYLTDVSLYSVIQVFLQLEPLTLV